MSATATLPKTRRKDVPSGMRPERSSEQKTKLISARRNLLIQTSVVVLSLVGWQLFSFSDTADKADMPSPLETLSALAELIPTAAYWSSVGATVVAWLGAFVACLLVGIPVGMLIGRNQKVSDSTHFLIDFLRTIPPIALIPLSLLIMGPSIQMVILSSFLAGVWPILIQSVYAARQLDPMLFQVSRSFRLRPRYRLQFVLAPDLVAFVWPGIRLAITATLLVTVASQLIGGAPGIGHSIQNALLNEKQTTMFAYVATAALFGLAVNSIMVLLQNKLLWWHPSLRKASR